MLEIQCLPDKQKVKISETQTILEAVVEAGIPHTQACGGKALCSTCRVMILDGVDQCTPPTAAEKALTQRLGFPQNIRLACQAGVSGNILMRRLVIDSEDIDMLDSQMSTNSFGERKSVAVLVAAIRGSTNFDEVKFPYDIVYVLGRYFSRTNKVINSYGGTINNYMGSRFMAVFGIDDLDKPAERAVWAGIEILQAVEELNVHLENMSYQPIKLSIAIHYGPVVAIPVDPSQPKQLTVIGDVVNLVNRIESLNKEVGSTLLVSEPVYYQVENEAMTGRQRSFNLPGRSSEYKLFEITGMRGEAPVKTEKLEPAPSLSQRMRSFMQKFSGSSGKK